MEEEKKKAGALKTPQAAEKKPHSVLAKSTDTPASVVSLVGGEVASPQKGQAATSEKKPSPSRRTGREKELKDSMENTIKQLQKSLKGDQVALLKKFKDDNDTLFALTWDKHQEKMANEHLMDMQDLMKGNEKTMRQLGEDLDAC